MEMKAWLALGISSVSLVVSALTAWFTLLHRGTVRMTKPARIFFGPDGERFLTYAELKDQREADRRRADSAEKRAERLAARLRELGVDPDPE